MILAHKDRTKHDRDDKWETPAEALSFGFWPAGDYGVGLVFGGMAMYVQSLDGESPWCPILVTTSTGECFKAPRLPKMLRRKAQKEDGAFWQPTCPAAGPPSGTVTRASAHGSW